MTVSSGPERPPTPSIVLVASSVGTVVSVPVSGGPGCGQALAAVARRLRAAGIAVTEIGLRLASLDEVFLALTGHSAQGQEQ